MVSKANIFIVRAYPPLIPTRNFIPGGVILRNIRYLVYLKAGLLVGLTWYYSTYSDTGVRGATATIFHHFFPLTPYTAYPGMYQVPRIKKYLTRSVYAGFQRYA